MASGKSVAARGAGVVAALWLLLIWTPMPFFGAWELRLVARETALVGVLFALIVLALAKGTGRLVAMALVVGTALPIVATWPRFWTTETPFSLAAYLGRSAPTPDVAVTRDVVLDAARPDLVADFYRRREGGRRPFVVVLHGGSWQHGDKGEVEHLSRRLAEAGVTVVDLRYRLSPDHAFPAAVADAKCALGRLRAGADRWQLDAAKAALLGRSAGGQLALLAAYSAGDPKLLPSCGVPDAPLAAVVALYPFTDLAGAYATPPVPDPEATRDVLEAHFAGPPDGLHAADYRRADPLTHAGAHSPPTLLIHGTSDMIVPVEHSRRMATLANVTLLTIPLADHAFDHRPGGAGDQLATAAIVRFVTTTLQ